MSDMLDREILAERRKAAGGGAIAPPAGDSVCDECGLTIKRGMIGSHKAAHERERKAKAVNANKLHCPWCNQRVGDVLALMDHYEETRHALQISIWMRSSFSGRDEKAPKMKAPYALTA